MNNNFVKSPLNYIGGKYKILPQIMPLFPKKIETFVDLFAGGCNVAINVDANKIYVNDNLTYLIKTYKAVNKNTLDATLSHIESRIKEFHLSLTNGKGYNALRQTYNKEKNPLDLFVLVAYSFNHQIRFNSQHEYNNPFGKNRSNFNENMKKNLINFITKLKEKNFIFTDLSFEQFDFSLLTSNDLVYCDPPYLITLGTYNDGKRGFKGWNKLEEILLYETLDKLNKKKVKFALSNVIDHKGKSNDILKKWIKSNSHYYINYLNNHYSNSNYHTKNRDRSSSIEVLITNYKTNI